MKTKTVLVIFFMATITHFTQAASLDTIEAFSKGSKYTDVKLSPDGTYLSALTTKDSKKMLIILETKTKKVFNKVAFLNTAEVGNYYWVNDERVVMEKVYKSGLREQSSYRGELIGANADGTKIEYLFGYNSPNGQTGSHIKKNTSKRAWASVIDPLLDNKKYMLIYTRNWGAAGNSEDDDAPVTIYKLNVYNGKLKKQFRSPSRLAYVQFLTTDEGEVVIATGEDRQGYQKIFSRQNDEWVNIDKYDFGISDLSPISLADNDMSLYVSGREGNEIDAVFKIDLTTGKKDKIVQDKVVDPSGYWINEETQKLYAVEFEDGLPTYAFVDKNDKYSKLLKQLLASLPGHQVRIISATEDSTQFIVNAFNDRNPGDYYFFDSNAMKMEYLGSVADWLNPEAMSEMKPISFTSRDGQTIRGFLTLPRGKEAKNLPLIVNPHGGPHGPRDWWGFNPQTQLLASEGYAVLNVNFRGSGGYGREFEVMGHNKWGTEIQYDIIDGTKYVIDQGIADAKKICIVGGSFGGYSAMQSSIIEPELFKCAIANAGVYDLPLWTQSSDVADSSRGNIYQSDVLGLDIETQESMSPVYHVDKLKTKLLLVHGEDDQRVPIDQLESLEKALKAIDYDYDRLVIEKEAHGFVSDESRATYYQIMLAFLGRQLK